MTSERKVAANQMNSRMSRGPRTAAGKFKASRNARRHGLSTISRANPTVSTRIELIAQAISRGNPFLHEAALVIAENTMLLGCMQTETCALITRLRVVDGGGPEVMHVALADLTRLARYERRAWSRQKRAMRSLMKLKFA
jgi:hypothetical protein